MAAQVSYGIPTWSSKTFKARYNYCCANCKGIIPSGTKYLRNVQRLGPKKGVDPLRNVHMHLDCQAPWYQPEATNRLPNLGRLPRKTPPVDVHDPSRYFHKPSVAVGDKLIGTLVWQPSEELSQKLAFTPRQNVSHGAIAEIESAQRILMTALVQAAGNQRKAMKLNHLIEQMTRLLDPLPSPVQPTA